ncbi:MAG: DUF512 domain-containing protein [Acidobacteria bacterium]|nr:DUF512 domain-containing protein [Acidobacteriota bacterium]
MRKKGLRILEVEPGTPADELGLAPGDRILTINDREIPDELALKFYLSEECVDLTVEKQGGVEESFEVDLSDRTHLGVKVEDFQTRTCGNACLFCFIDQLPEGVRPSLKVKDDDYRLSFLHGNYITLTNLPERELDRIIEQRLSPLYVSVHATDPQLRARMLGRKRPDDLNGKLTRLIRGMIRIHAQIVLMPEINDGANLRKTVFDLYELHPGVQSIAIVPLGLSEHGNHRDRFAPVTGEYSRALIEEVLPWQENFRNRTGTNFAYLADEFYILGGVEIPDSDYYDDFAQIEDGIGMVRSFLDGFKTEMRRRRSRLLPLRGTIATGTLFFPTLHSCIEQINSRFGFQLQVLETENRFLGRSITVAGLLAGRDILAALRGRDPGDFLIIPQEAVSRVEGILLDNLTPADLEREIGKPVYPGGRTVRDFFRLLKSIGSGAELKSL